MIDREWLEKVLRGAAHIWQRPIPESDWPAVMDLWCNVLADCDQPEIEKAVMYALRTRGRDDLRPDVIWQRIKRPVDRIGVVIEATCDVASVSKEALLGGRRYRKIARPRTAAMAIASLIPGKSFPQVGQAFHRDHTTVMHACTRAKHLLKTDHEFASMYTEIERRMSGGGS